VPQSKAVWDDLEEPCLAVLFVLITLGLSSIILMLIQALEPETGQCQEMGSSKDDSAATAQKATAAAQTPRISMGVTVGRGVLTASSKLIVIMSFLLSLFGFYEMVNGFLRKDQKRGFNC